MTQTPRVIRMSKNGPDKLAPLVLHPQDFQSALPQQNMHVYYDDPERGLTVGVWDSTAMQETFGPYPGDEFIVVLDGEFDVLDTGGAAVSVKQGQFAAFHSGVPVSWKQSGYLKKFYLKLRNPNAHGFEQPAAEGEVIIIDPMTNLTDADMLDAEDAADPVEREKEFFTNDAETMTVGLWDCRASSGEMEPFPAHEIVFVVDGEVTISEPGGIGQTFHAGDTFFVPKGTMCSWHIPNYIRKFFAAVDHDN